MKLKYYLRGVGIGILFATLVMTVSAWVHKYNITDEYIIQRARKLGMVMKEELKDNNGLWGSEDTEDTEASQSTEDVKDTQNSQSTEDSQTSEDSQTPENSQTSEDTQVAGSENAPPESESESQRPEYATIVIVRGDFARQVAEKLVAAGVITDSEEFRIYMGNHGYAYSIHAGTYRIPWDATYEEICKIVAG